MNESRDRRRPLELAAEYRRAQVYEMTVETVKFEQAGPGD